MVVYTSKPRSLEIEAGRLGLPGQYWLQSKFETSLDYIKSCLKKKLFYYMWILFQFKISGFGLGIPSLYTRNSQQNENELMVYNGIMPKAMCKYTEQFFKKREGEGYLQTN